MKATASLDVFHHDLQKLADPARASHSQKFFKTGPGEYAEGDRFIGLTVPQCRILVKRYQQLDLPSTLRLLHSGIHEERLIALLILVRLFAKSNDRSQKQIYDLYLKNTKYVNNWDLVDLTAPRIVGEYLLGKPTEILIRLAKSKSLWDRRIAILATFAFIYKGNPKPTLQISEILLSDKHDLIHKATGWMLREVGKRISRDTEESFLKKHYRSMPRTMLRYAIERFPETLRRQYLRGAI